MAQLQLAFDQDEFLNFGIDEPLLYHDAERSGFTALLSPSSNPRQRAVRLHELPAVLEQERRSGHDLYIAQNEFFKPNRLVVNCSRLTSCYVDLDTYKLDSLYGQPAEALTDRLLRQCDDLQMPPPSIIVYSGRGLQAKWILERPVPRGALPRWQALQAELGRRLLPLGADVRALDASRVLRLVGSVNSRSGDIVRVMHLQRVPTYGATIGSAGVAVYAFDSFFDEMLPITRQELAEKRAELVDCAARAENIPAPLSKSQKPKQRQLQVVESGRHGTARRIIPSELAWDRLADLRKLSELRHADKGIPSGQRNLFVFLGACFLATALVAPRFRAEVRELAREFAPTWTSQELESCISSVQGRLEAAAKGETINYLGQPVDPRYRFRNSTLLDWLGVSDSEMRHMRTIVSRDESQRRDRERKTAARRAAGRPSLQDLRESRSGIKTQAQDLRSQGMSWREIAKTLGISQTSARRHCAKPGDTHR